jgi:hypothetical protein
MVAFIDDHQETIGVGLISATLPIAPSTSYEHKAEQADSERCSPRRKCNAILREETMRV